MRKCTHCNSDVEEDSSFCTSCGQQLLESPKCIKCGKSIDEDCDWCTHCGAKQIIEANNEELPNQQKRCIQCSEIIDEDCDWCTYCGTKQTTEFENEVIQYPHQSEHIEYNKKKYENHEVEQMVADKHLQKEITYHPQKNKTPMLIIVLLLVIFLGGGAFFFFHRQMSESASQRLIADSIHLADSIRLAEIRLADSIRVTDSIAVIAYNEEQAAVTENDGVICPEPRCGGVDVTNIAVVASHTLKNQGSNPYQASNLLDSDSNTAWATHFTGEKETLTFTMNVNRLYKIVLINGYRKDTNSFSNNSRAQDVRIYVDGILAAKTVCSDEDYENLLYWPEFIMLDREYDNVKEVKIVISSVYQGNKWNDLCISDVDFYTKE